MKVVGEKKKKVRCKVAEQPAGLLRLCCITGILLTPLTGPLRVRWPLDVWCYCCLHTHTHAVSAAVPACVLV